MKMIIYFFSRKLKILLFYIPMLLKESLEALNDIPLRVQKTIGNVQFQENEIKEYMNEIQAIMDKGDGKPEQMISALLRVQEKEEIVLAQLNTLNQFLKDQVKIVDDDCDNFDEIIAKSALMIKTNQISNKELGYENTINKVKNLLCFCGKNTNEKMVACDGIDCPIEWYHLGCVGLVQPPSGKWVCRACREKNND